MKQIPNEDRICSLCESSQIICGGEYCLCSKKGVVSPDYCCKKFCFDPLKIRIAVRKLPEFTPDLIR